MCKVGQNHIYIYVIFGRKITKFTVLANPVYVHDVFWVLDHNIVPPPYTEKLSKGGIGDT
jgi:hypothetical protein